MATTGEVQQPVLISIRSDDDTMPEWAMIELNGELLPPKDNVPPSGVTSNDDDTIELGSFHFDDEQCPVMVVGTHQLRGVVESLSQPLCILQKHEQDSYTVSGIVKQKILFNQYPKTLMR